MQNTPSVKESIVRKLDSLPDALVQTVSAILDDLITYHQKQTKLEVVTPISDELTDNDTDSQIKPFESWDEFFDEVEKLPESPELSTMTKQQRKDLFTEYLQEKYKNTSLDLS